MSPCWGIKIYIITLSVVTSNIKGMIDSSCGFSFQGMSCLLWLLSPLKEFFVEAKNNLKNSSYNFFVFISFALLQSKSFNFLRSFQIILFQTNFTQIPVNRYEKVIAFIEFSVNGKNMLRIFPTRFSSLFHYFICIATVKLLHFLTFISDLSVFNKFYSNAFFKSMRESYM